MKTIPIQQLDPQIREVLSQQDEGEAVRLTNDDGTIGFLLRVPETLRDAEAGVVVFTEGPAGRVYAILEGRHGTPIPPSEERPTPRFGAGKGSLTIVSDDDDHLADFAEYM